MPARQPPREASAEPELAGAGALTRRRFVIGAGSVAVAAGAGALGGGCGEAHPPLEVRSISTLPQPRGTRPVSLERVLSTRRSHREFTTQPLTEQEISQLLWAAQGITASWGGRTAPSAGGLYPLELYLLTPDAYRHYLSRGHRVELLANHDLRGELATAALNQSAARTAPLTLVITAVYARTVRKYGARGRRYAELEAGHVGQNVLLQATALGLAAVPIGAFDDHRLAHALRLPSDHAPLYIVALGHAR